MKFSFLDSIRFGVLAVIAGGIWGLTSCREEYRHFDRGEVYLQFSQDTIRFDTVFTTQNSITKRIAVRNPSQEAVSIDRIYLEGGGRSRFRFNLNGDTSLSQHGVVIAGQDSIYLFVNTVIDYRDQDNPFEIQDYIKFELNGMRPQQVVLSAWGQDAHYWTSDREARIPYVDPMQFGTVDTLRLDYFLWDEAAYPVTGGKPYVVYGYLTVASGKTLAIPAGSRFYFGPNSGIWVQDGAKLEIQGSEAEPVLFTGIRQDGEYRNMAGQWGRIWLAGESGPHRVEYALIRNGQSGLWLDSCAGGNSGLYVANTRIENMSRYGLLVRQNRTEGVNLCIAESQVNLGLAEGGDYDFRHCTFSNDYRSGGMGYNQCLVLNNYRLDEQGEKVAFPLERAGFHNSIFYGRNSRQIGLDLTEDALSEVRFTRCLIRMEPVPTGDAYDSCFWNTDPFFANPDYYDFTIDTVVSAAVGVGDPIFATGAAAFDIKGRPRANPPTLGAYEFVPKEEGMRFFRMRRK